MRDQQIFPLLTSRPTLQASIRASLIFFIACVLSSSGFTSWESSKVFFFYHFEYETYQTCTYLYGLSVVTILFFDGEGLLAKRRSLGRYSLLANSGHGIWFSLGLLAPRPTPKLEDHPLSFVCGCLFNIFSAMLHSWRPFLHLQPEDVPCCGDRNPPNI
jgi:hypothetical protein